MPTNLGKAPTTLDDNTKRDPSAEKGVGSSFNDCLGYISCFNCLGGGLLLGLQ
jgi:hypothetical protein